ncbi:glycosyltransferase family 2 protein [Bifidobacterium oedipodis]|uniref:Glycosyltransferase family 2 n=1 Tax=Bifidobacterium oedipodis TaxID=2675322 RepID=A0A7Y0HUX9_9BIFI|nr:glycosyltransferase family 2 protein [Bifidobacterium sp. DSM 109957]NMM95239.1 glycosyltransferase family 2 [Bifidobacterium sp. DSM 109957]
MNDNLKKTSPLISVIVPVYKVEAYLDRCVQSIINQTYSNMEIFLVDDGSPDSCPCICEKWAKKDNRIHVIHKTNGGLASARNAGLDACTGSYIGFVDSDDYIEPDMYATLMKNIQSFDAELSIIGVKRVYEDGKVHAIGPKIGPIAMDSAEAFRYINLPGYFDVAAWNKLASRTLFENLRYPTSEKTAEDYPVTYALLDKAETIVYDSKACYSYCQYSRTTLSGGISDAKYRFSLQMLRLVQEHYPESIDYALYGHVFASVSMYDAILSSRQLDKYRSYEKEVINLVKKSYPTIRKKIQLPTLRRMQISFLYHSPALYKLLFLFYKHMNKKLID